jgi:hypothetical protein
MIMKQAISNLISRVARFFVQEKANQSETTDIALDLGISVNLTPDEADTILGNYSNLKSRMAALNAILQDRSRWVINGTTRISFWNEFLYATAYGSSFLKGRCAFGFYPELWGLPPVRQDGLLSLSVHANLPVSPKMAEAILLDKADRFVMLTAALHDTCDLEIVGVPFIQASSIKAYNRANGTDYAEATIYLDDSFYRLPVAC